MGRDRLRDIKDRYDVIVIGSGLAGMTAANRLAKCGRSVLLVEQHNNKMPSKDDFPTYQPCQHIEQGNDCCRHRHRSPPLLHACSVHLAD